MTKFKDVYYELMTIHNVNFASLDMCLSRPEIDLPFITIDKSDDFTRVIHFGGNHFVIRFNINLPATTGIYYTYRLLPAEIYNLLHQHHFSKLDIVINAEERKTMFMTSQDRSRHDGSDKDKPFTIINDFGRDYLSALLKLV